MFTLSPAYNLDNREIIWVWNDIEKDETINVFLKSFEVQAFVDQKFNIHHI